MYELGVVKRNITRADAAAVEKIGRFGSATVHESQGRVGLMNTYMRPICAGACIDSQYRTFLDAMWAWNANHLITGYYDGELQLLSMVVASGNWWSTA